MVEGSRPFALVVSYQDAEGRAATLVTAALACYLVAGGVLSLAGWAYDAPRLADWAGAGIAIQPNACVCVLCSGLALAMLVRREGESLDTLLRRLDAAIVDAYDNEHFTDEVNVPTRPASHKPRR